MKRKILLFTILVLACITGIFAGPPGDIPSVTTNENATSVAPKIGPSTAISESRQTKEAPDIGMIGSVMFTSHYIRTEVGVLIANKKEEKKESSPVTESTPKYGCATTVQMIPTKKEKEENNLDPSYEGLPARFTDFKQVIAINTEENGDERTQKIDIRSRSYPALVREQEVLTDFETTSVVSNSIESKEDEAESIQKE